MTIDKPLTTGEPTPDAQVFVRAEYKDIDRLGQVDIWYLPVEYKFEGRPEADPDLSFMMEEKEVRVFYKSRDENEGERIESVTSAMSLDDFARLSLVLRTRGGVAEFGGALNVGELEPAAFGVEDLTREMMVTIEEQSGFRKALVQVLNHHIATLYILEAIRFRGLTKGIRTSREHPDPGEFAETRSIN